MIGYRAALDLGNHTGMTKASGIVFWGQPWIRSSCRLSVQMWQWKKFILVCCTKLEVFKLSTIFRHGICCRDGIELGLKQHVHSVLEAWTLALVLKFPALTEENGSSRYVTQNTLSRIHLLNHPALRWLQSHRLWKVLFLTSKGESSLQHTFKFSVGTSWIFFNCSPTNSWV